MRLSVFTFALFASYAVCAPMDHDSRVNVRDADPDGLVAYPNYRRDVGEKRDASQDELVAYPDYRRDIGEKRDASQDDLVAYPDYRRDTNEKREAEG